LLIEGCPTQAVCNTQLLEEAPENWGKVFNAFERTFYDHLK
jgi:hypothetical protein